MCGRLLVWPMLGAIDLGITVTASAPAVKHVGPEDGIAKLRFSVVVGNAPEIGIRYCLAFNGNLATALSSPAFFLAPITNSPRANAHRRKCRYSLGRARSIPRRPTFAM